MNRRSPRRTVGSALGLAALLAGVAGCVNQGPPPREPPRPIPTQPEGIPATVMSFNVAPPSDENNNGNVDTFDATVYLFNDNYAFALAIPGALNFTLSDRKGKVLARWSFDEARTSKMMKDLPPGPGYLVRLSLLDLGAGGNEGAGSDALESQVAELSCEFLPSKGLPVRSKGSRAVRVGKQH